MAFVETIDRLRVAVFKACLTAELHCRRWDSETSGNRTMSIFCHCCIASTISFKIATVSTLTEPLCVCHLQHLHSDNETSQILT